MRIVLGANDPEMVEIKKIVQVIYPDAQLVQPEPDEPGKSANLVTVEPQAGDLWIEAACAPHMRLQGGTVLTPRQHVEAAGAVMIDHHNADDGDHGWAFANSSIGRLLRHAAMTGAIQKGSPAEEQFGMWHTGFRWPVPADEGKWVLDDGITGDARLYLIVGGKVVGGCIPPHLIMTGESDHSLGAFVNGSRHAPNIITSAERASAFLLARLSPEDQALVTEAREAIQSCPWLPGYEGKVRDLRGCADLTPPSKGAHPGGRLQGAARTALQHERIAYVTWGAQPFDPDKGRNAVFGGAGEGSVVGVIDHAPILEALGASGVYGSERRGFGGGYVLGWKPEA